MSTPLTADSHGPAHAPAYLLPFLASLIALGPLAIDAYLPAFPEMAREFGVDPVRINFTMSAYLVGLAIGQIIGGPISDQLGRKRVGAFGLGLFMFMSTVILGVSDFGQLVGLRMIQAIGGGLASAVAIPTLRDASSPDKAASRIAIVYLIMLIAPLVAPVIGVILLQFGWRWIFGFLTIYATALLACYLTLIPETRPPSHRRPQFQKIFSQYQRVIRHRLDGQLLPIRYGLATSLGSGIMLIYLTNASFIFQTHYQIDTKWFPLYFGINVLGMAAVQSISARYLRNLKLPKIAGYLRFGHRLQFCMLSLLVLVVAFFDPPIELFMSMLVLGICCGGITGPSGSGVYLSSYRKLSGSASAILTTSTFISGSALGFVSGLFNTGNLVPAASALLVASLLANLILASINREEEKEILNRISRGEIEPL